MSMFRSAATKIAHNSTLPALGGNKDLRPLQDLITAEKAVLISLQKLSHDVLRSNECLRHWGSGEGDDLQDTLSAAGTILSHFANALSQLATHEMTIREQMKAVRSREENLDDLKKRRKAVAAKADSAEKKLSKMNPENKNLHQQTELLNNLRDQIRTMDWDILNDEAKLGDFKRMSTKTWLAIKFGGVLECAEKTTIVGEIGKLVIEEIPQAPTQPGQPRAFYTGHEKTEKLIAEAQRCVSEVVFDPQNIQAGLGVGEGAKSSIDGFPASTNDLSSQQYNTSPAAVGGIGADEFGGISGNERRSSRFGFGTFGGGSGGEGNSSPTTSRFTGGGGGQFSTFPNHQAGLSPELRNQGLSMSSADQDDGQSSFAAEVADALAYAEGGGEAAQPHTQSTVQGYGGLPRGAAPPSTDQNPWENSPSHPSHMREPGQSTYEHYADPDLTYGRSSQDQDQRYPPPAHPPPGHVHFSAQDPPPHPTQAHIPPNEEDDEAARNAAAAREVAREMDMLTFSPPPGPPPGNIQRQPSPLIPPAPPFAHETEEAYGGHSYGGGEYGGGQEYDGAIPPAPSEGPPSTPKAEPRGPSNLALDPPSPQIDRSSAHSSPTSPRLEHRSRPSLITSPAPSHSYQSSTSGYATPPEVPFTRDVPGRTGSPLSASVLSPGSAVGGPRTISAAAFKRPGMRSASNSSTPTAGVGGGLPDVSPLALRKKVPGSGSPYVGGGSPLPDVGAGGPASGVAGVGAGGGFGGPGSQASGRRSLESHAPSEAAPPYSELGHDDLR